MAALTATGIAVGAAFSGTDLLKGIAGLIKFFATVDDAKSEEDLKDCGKLFGDAVAKIGVNGLFFVMSMFGLKKASARLTARTIADSNPNSGKWNWKRIEKTREKIIIEQYNVQNKCVGNTNIFIENFSSEDVPSVANGRFNDFFNSLTVDEIDFFWNKPDIKSSIESRLRSPGGLHEWHLVSRAPTFKYWGISAETIKELRTSIIDVEFINPKGTHGGARFNYGS